MPGPRKHYLKSEADAQKWILKHLPPLKTRESVRSPDPIYLPAFLPLYDKNCTGRALPQPLYKLAIPPSRTRTPFHISFSAASSNTTSSPPPPSRPNGFHPSHSHDASTTTPGFIPPSATDEHDADPALALHDFTHQLTCFADAAAAPGAELAQRQHCTDQILAMEGAPHAHRVIVNEGLKDGTFSADNLEHVMVLMNVLKHNAEVGKRPEGEGDEDADAEGGKVLGEVLEEEDGGIEKVGVACDVGVDRKGEEKSEGGGGGGKVMEVQDVKKAVGGRLKGKARKDAKKAAK